ncbi:MAG TPA: serine hydrolase domain-containing protein [Longimicrobiales bacterium]
MRTIGVVLLLVLAVASPARAQGARSLDEVVEAALSRAFTPGAVVAVVVRDTIALLQAFGRTALEEDAPPLEPDALFRAGGLGEVLNALAAVQLAQQGALRMDEPLGTAVPELPRQLRAVTVSQLLTHTAGLAQHVSVPGRGGADDLGAAARGLTPLDRLAPAGTYYSNSSIGIALAALAVERAAKRPHAEAVQQLVLDPVGMERSTYDLAAVHDSLTPGWHPSSSPDARVVPAAFAPDDATGVPLRGFITTARDVARLAAALLTDGIVEGERVLPEGVAAAALEPRADVPFSRTRAALGVRMSERGTSPLVNVSGGGLGHSVMMQLLPRERVGVVVLTNSSVTGLGGVPAFVFDRLLGEAPATAAPPTQPADSSSLRLLAAQAGRYLNGAELIEIEEQNGLPVLRSGDLLLPIRPLEDGAFAALIDNRVALRFHLLIDDTGQVYLWLGDRALARRVPGARRGAAEVPVGARRGAAAVPVGARRGAAAVPTEGAPKGPR